MLAFNTMLAWETMPTITISCSNRCGEQVIGSHDDAIKVSDNLPMDSSVVTPEGGAVLGITVVPTNSNGNNLLIMYQNLYRKHSHMHKLLCRPITQ